MDILLKESFSFLSIDIFKKKKKKVEVTSEIADINTSNFILFVILDGNVT